MSSSSSSSKDDGVPASPLATKITIDEQKLTQSPERITMARGMSSLSSSTSSNDEIIGEDLKKLSIVDLSSSKTKQQSSPPGIRSAPEHTRINYEGSGSSTSSHRSPVRNPVSQNHVRLQNPQRSQPQHNQQHPYSGTGSDNDSTTMTGAASQAGILASGLAWVDRQREKRRRQYLQMQAEQQLQKIADAERARKAASSGGSRDGSGIGIGPSSSSSSTTVPNRHLTTQNGQHHRPHPNHQQLKGSGSHDSGGGCGNADISKSGEGATGRLDLSDLVSDNDDDGTNDDTDYSNPSTSKGYSSSEFDRSNKGNPDYDNGDDFDDDDDDDEFPIPEVRVDKVAGDDDPNNPFILTPDQMHQVACHVLPKTIAFCRWRRLYDLGRDGDSFDGCLRIIGNVQRTLMVVRTSKGSIFGGYSESPWHSQAQYGDARFFGSAAACLYSFSSATATSSSTTTKGTNTSTKISVYKWTGKNRYIQLCDLSHKMIAFGGGGDDGAFGLCLQEDFQRGSTGPCDTFDNDPLCQEDNFDIVDVEFWEFMTGVF